MKINNTYRFIVVLSIFVMVCFSVFAQETIVVGEVFDSRDKTPLPEVNVILKNTTQGVKTDNEGFFLIRINGQEPVLQFSCIGYATKEVKIKPGKNVGIQVYMQEQNTVLQEVFVIPGANPAIPLMNRVRAKRSDNNYLITPVFGLNYNVTYHYRENYVNAQGTPESCTTTVTKGFRVLNEAADFWGYNHMDVICGTQDSVVITGNKAPLGRFVFTGPAANFKDRGNGTAVIYPPTLSVGSYQVTYYYDHKNTQGVTICSTEQAKTFKIAQIAPIEDISVFCSSGNNAIRIPNTELGVEYELQVNGVTFEKKMGTGTILEFSPITDNTA